MKGFEGRRVDGGFEGGRVDGGFEGGTGEKIYK